MLTISGDPWVTETADYFTKYSMTDTYRDHDVHGLVADGTRTADNSTYGAWMVYNTKDTFYGGPTYSELTVDGLVSSSRRRKPLLTLFFQNT